MLGNSFTNKPVTIIGAGISGLALGFFLKKKGIPFRIIEKEDRPGGLLQTYKDDYGIYEGAANGFLWCEEIQEIADAIKLDLLQPLPSAQKRFIVRNKKLHRFPLIFAESLQAIFKFLKASPLKGNTTLKEFSDHYFGNVFSHQLFNPAIGGIYAADISELGVNAVFPQFSNGIKKRKIFQLFGRKKGKGLFSLKEGMGTLTKALSEYLREHITYAKTYNQVSDTEMVITTPAFEAAKMFKDPFLNQLLREVEYIPVISVTMICNKRDFNDLKEGFGCVIPRNEELNSLGILFNNFIFEGRVNSSEHASITCIARMNDELNRKSDGEVIALFTNELITLFKFSGIPLSYKIFRYNQGIPLYSNSLSESWKVLDKLLREKHPSIRLFGNYTGELSIRGICEEAKKCVSEIAKCFDN